MVPSPLGEGNLNLLYSGQTQLYSDNLFKGKSEKNKYQCPHCWEGCQPGGSLETSSHLLVCAAYADLREGLEPEAILEDRARYLRKVICRRKLLETQLGTGRKEAETDRNVTEGS